MMVPSDVLRGALVGVVLLLVTLPLTTRGSDRRVARIIAWGLALKLMAAPAQLIVAATFYNNIADANRYHRQGLLASSHLAQGRLPPGTGNVIGSTFIELLTGAMYLVITPTKLGGFFVYSWLGFCGLFFFYRAFQLTFPETNHARYAMLIFFLPSLLFWPSAIGKDAWMTMALGIAAYGAARLVTHRRGGFLLLGLGLAAAVMVRPHVAALLFMAASVAYALPAIGRRTAGQRAAKIAGITALVVAGIFVMASVQKFFHVERLDLETIDQVLSKTEQLSATGRQRGDEKVETGYGSSFDASGSRSPMNFPRTVVTVLFRPLPWEAHNLPALASSLEGCLLILIVIGSRRRLRMIPKLARRNPYVAFCVLYTLVFIYFFSSIGNLGILARQRVQLLPFFLALLALPIPEPRPRPERGMPKHSRASGKVSPTLAPSAATSADGTDGVTLEAVPQRRA